MQTRSSHENFICPSVCLSVCLSNVYIVTKRKKICLVFIRCERSFSLIFWEEEWLVEATTSNWNFGPTGPRLSKIEDFEPIIAHSASAVRPSQKRSINTNRKSLTRFPTSLRWSSYVASVPQRRAQKRKTAVFPLKSHFVWRKSATKFLCVKTFSGKVVEHSLA